MSIGKTLLLRQLLMVTLSFILFFHSPMRSQIPIHSPDRNQALLNEPLDISSDFRNFSNTYYLADSLSTFDPKTGKGEITYRRNEYVTRRAFNNMLRVLRPVRPNEFPSDEYAVSPNLSFSIEFVSPRNVHIRASSRFQVRPDPESLMLVNGKAPLDKSYARYGLSEKPVEQAAHLAADWVRHDGSRTKFWELGNENAGPWEAGWQIDTTLNKDDQPEIITGELYGKHFKIFADSMRAAAAELDETIYIGGQILHYDGTSSWNIADRKWNEGFFKEVSDAADFYVIHNYFGGSNSTLRAQIDAARSAIVSNINFIHQDITNKQAFSKPVALTEWNCGGPDLAKISIANGMQAVVLFCEMIKNNFGMSDRWLVANWESDGMFYFGNSSNVPRWNPRPDFFFIYYLQRFLGDHAVKTAFVGSSKDILAYATRFSSGEISVVVINKGTADQVVKLAPADYDVGERFYIYSLTGIDDSQWPQGVIVNDDGPTSQAWGPLDSLEDIPARAYSVGDMIKFNSPARSV